MNDGDQNGVMRFVLPAQVGMAYNTIQMLQSALHQCGEAEARGLRKEEAALYQAACDTIRNFITGEQEYGMRVVPQSPSEPQPSQYAPLGHPYGAFASQAAANASLQAGPPPPDFNSGI